MRRDQSRLAGNNRCGSVTTRVQQGRDNHQHARSRQHQKLRAALLPSAYGKACSRCGLPMLPGQALHLDHDDYDRTKCRGFTTRHATLRAAARKPRAIQLCGISLCGQRPFGHAARGDFCRRV